MADSDELLSRILTVVETQKEDLHSLTMATILIHMSTLSYLAEIGLLTNEQAAQRLEAFHSSLPTPLVGSGSAVITLLIEALRQIDKQPGKRWTPEVIQGGLGRDLDDEQ